MCSKRRCFWSILSASNPNDSITFWFVFFCSSTSRPSSLTPPSPFSPCLLSSSSSPPKVWIYVPQQFLSLQPCWLVYVVLPTDTEREEGSGEVKMRYLSFLFLSFPFFFFFSLSFFHVQQEHFIRRILLFPCAVQTIAHKPPVVVVLLT